MLEKKASENNRSLNGEIVYRLTQSLKSENPSGVSSTLGLDRSDKPEPTNEYSNTNTIDRQR